MSKIYRLIVLLLVILLPVNVFAKVVSSVEYNGYVYDIGYVCDFQVDSISYIIRENGVYVSAEMYLVDSVGYSTLSTVPWEVVINNSYQGTVTIPETVNYGDTIYDVIGIADAAFKGCINLNQIVFPISVTHIGNAAFYGCSNLKEVTLPPSLSVLGLDVFRNCTGLESVSFPDNLKVIGVGAFRECSKLRYLIIPDSVGKIDYLSFYGCSGLKKLYIPANVSEINITAFANCFWIDSIIWDSPLVLPDVVVSICKGSLSYFRFGNEIKYISQYAFGGCIKLTSITIPEEVVYLGDFSFQNCTNLKTIVFEGNPTIYSYAFIGCSSIDSIILKSQTPPAAVFNYINTDGNTELFFTDAAYKNAVLCIPEGSYYDYAASDLWSKFISLYSYKPGGYESDFESDTIYYTIEKDGAFVSAKYIDINDFGRIYGYDGPLTPRDPITGGQQPRTGRRSVLKRTSADSLGYNHYRGTVVIPESVSFNDTTYTVSGINYFTFIGCKELESVFIPESVKQLGYGSFVGCEGLKSVNIPSGVTLIPDAMFYGCTSLDGLEISSGVDTIGHSAFYECASLTEIIIPEGVKLIDEYAFAYCSGLKRVIIEGNPEIAETAFIGCGTELEVVMTRVEKIKATDTDVNAEGAVHYSVDGRKIPADAPGLHIIKYKNGTVGKAWVR
ncbi:MAG: leucine-rich repeat domain-containing protein [Bacteroidaceae bacterium]|nr:leucine-rich repeat domain-containing protein [Bacteroidaceae bacterium]